MRERFGNRRRPIAGAFTTAGNFASAILRLPEIQDALAVGLLVVVGDREGLGPIAAVTVGGPYHPGWSGAARDAAEQPQRASASRRATAVADPAELGCRTAAGRRRSSS
jgi:hypothetical protein